MNRWPTLSDYLSAELYAVAMAMLDGSYYQPGRDDQIEYCGSNSFDTGAGGGEGE